MIGTFCLIYWLQSMDKNFNKKKNFDKFKFPILSSSIVGLIAKYFCESKNIGSSFKTANNQEIFTEVPDF